MPKRLVLHITFDNDLVERKIKKWKEKGLSVPSFVNKCLRRYLTMVQDLAPELTPWEQSVVAEMCNGSIIDDLFIKTLHEDVLLMVDCGTPQELKALAYKIKDLSYVERLAMIEKLGF